MDREASMETIPVERKPRDGERFRAENPEEVKKFEAMRLHEHLLEQHRTMKLMSALNKMPLKPAQHTKEIRPMMPMSMYPPNEAVRYMSKDGSTDRSHFLSMQPNVSKFGGLVGHPRRRNDMPITRKFIEAGLLEDPHELQAEITRDKLNWSRRQKRVWA